MKFFANKIEDKTVVKLPDGRLGVFLKKDMEIILPVTANNEKECRYWVKGNDELEVYLTPLDAVLRFIIEEEAALKSIEKECEQREREQDAGKVYDEEKRYSPEEFSKVIKEVRNGAISKKLAGVDEFIKKSAARSYKAVDEFKKETGEFVFEKTPGDVLNDDAFGQGW